MIDGLTEREDIKDKRKWIEWKEKANGRAFAPLFHTLHPKATNFVAATTTTYTLIHSARMIWESKESWEKPNRIELYRHCAHAHPFTALLLSLAHQDIVKLITHSAGVSNTFFHTLTHSRWNFPFDFPCWWVCRMSGGKKLCSQWMEGAHIRTQPQWLMAEKSIFSLAHTHTHAGANVLVNDRERQRGWESERASWRCKSTKYFYTAP